jgi:glycosyltransferase involved in cell wall biosynthesis
LIGWLDEGAMQEALREADVLVHLSTIDSFPLIVLEALAAGTLPLVFPMAGVEAMLARLDGMVVDAADPVASGLPC